MMPDTAFVVSVKHNVVTQIAPATADTVPTELGLDDPLAISTLLANNNKTNGCMDGDYFLDSFESARQFAALCIGFQKSLCDKSLAAVMDTGRGGGETWVNPFIPGEKG